MRILSILLLIYIIHICNSLHIKHSVLCDCSAKSVPSSCGCDGRMVPSVQDTCIVGQPCHDGAAKPSVESDAYRMQGTSVQSPSAATPHDCAPNVVGSYNGNCHHSISAQDHTNDNNAANYCGSSGCQSQPSIKAAQEASISDCTCKQPAPAPCECTQKPKCKCPEPPKNQCNCHENNPTSNGNTCSCVNSTPPPCPCQQQQQQQSSNNNCENSCQAHQQQLSNCQNKCVSQQVNSCQNSCQAHQQQLNSCQNSCQSSNNNNCQNTCQNHQQNLSNCQSKCNNQQPQIKTCQNSCQMHQKQLNNCQQKCRSPGSKSAVSKSTNSTISNTTKPIKTRVINCKLTKDQATLNPKLAKMTEKALKVEKSDEDALESDERDYRLAQAKASLALKRVNEIQTKLSAVQEALSKANKDGLPRLVHKKRQDAETVRKNLNMALMDAQNTAISAKNALIKLQHRKLDQAEKVAERLSAKLSKRFSEYTAKKSPNTELKSEINALVKELHNVHDQILKRLRMVMSAMVDASKANTNGLEDRKKMIREHINDLTSYVTQLRDSGKKEDLKNASIFEKSSESLVQQIKALDKQISEAKIKEAQTEVKAHDEILHHINELINKYKTLGKSSCVSKGCVDPEDLSVEHLVNAQNELKKSSATSKSNVEKVRKEVQKVEEKQEAKEENEEDEDEETEEEIEELLNNLANCVEPNCKNQKQQTSSNNNIQAKNNQHRTHINAVVTNNNGLSIDLTDDASPKVQIKH